MMKRKGQVSESLYLGMILAVSGGLMDAYSYLYRDQVFANAQTGNMLLLGVHLAAFDFRGAFYYLCPVAAFAIGIIISDIINHKHPQGHRLHWRQVAILIEAVVLLIVAFFPQSLNLAANSLTSLVCGIQVESFRKIHGNGITTTMCIGNLRSGIQYFCDFLFEHDKQKLRKSLLYSGIILCFVMGAVIGSFVIRMIQAKAIIVSSVLLMIVFVLMFRDGEAPEEELSDIIDETVGD